MPHPETHEVYLDCPPTMQVIANADVDENEVVFLSVTASGRCRAFKAQATTNAAGLAHTLFIVRRAGKAGQPCEITPLRAVYQAVTSGAVGDPVYLSAATAGAVTLTSPDPGGPGERAVGTRIPGGYLFNGSI